MFDDENKYIEGHSNFLQEKIQDEAIITYRVKSVEQLTDSRSPVIHFVFPEMTSFARFTSINRTSTRECEMMKTQSERYLK